MYEGYITGNHINEEIIEKMEDYTKGIAEMVNPISSKDVPVLMAALKVAHKSLRQEFGIEAEIIAELLISGVEVEAERIHVPKGMTREEAIAWYAERRGQHG